MKATELRIGNYVFTHNKISLNNTFIENSSSKVQNINGTDIVAIENQYEDWYNPIPLSEEWLLKLGFEKNSSMEWFKEIESKISAAEAFVIYQIDWRTFQLMVNNIPVEIKDVHQLQNVYFALTGKELTLK